MRPTASGTPPTARGDQRQPARERLVDDHAVRLAARRQHDDVRPGVGPVEGGPVSAPGRCHPVAETRARRSGGAGRRRRPAPGPAARRRRTSTAGRATSVSAATSRSWPLCQATVATHSSCPPSAVPGASGAGSVPGDGHVHPGRVQRVRAQDQGARPVARGDDGVRGAQHGALALPGTGDDGARAAPHRAAGARARRAAAGGPRGPAPTGAAEATSPSTTTTASSGTGRASCASACSGPASGAGQAPGHRVLAAPASPRRAGRRRARRS